MKHNIKLYFAAGLIGLTASCTDLDVPVESQYTEYPSSDIALQAKMADIYYTFAGPVGRRYNESQELSSDEALGLSFDGAWVDGNTNMHTCLHDFKPGDAAIDWYQDMPAGITKANMIIRDLESDGFGMEMIAPARVMRAFFHFILMDSFGDTPILDALPTDDEPIERAPRKEVAKFIEKELLECLPYMTEANDASTYGKPNKWMAEALLAKLYINWAVYTQDAVENYDAATAVNEKLADCVKYCDEIIKSGQFTLEGGADNYRKKFFFDNGPQIEDFIYAIPYDKVKRQGMTYARFRTFRSAAKGSFALKGKTFDGYNYFGWNGNSWGGNICLTPEMADLFSLEGDDRNGVVVGGPVYVYNPATREPYEPKIRWYYEGEPVEFTKDVTLTVKNVDFNVGNTKAGMSQGYKSIKYYPEKDEYVTYSRNQSNDVPVFRFADILLTKAEAIVRGATATNGDTPMSLFNQVRGYAHAPLLEADPTLSELLDERGREFFEENWRRNDMIRFGTFESEYGFHKQDFPGANFDKRHRVFPIPTGIMNENTTWKQNPGY